MKAKVNPALFVGIAMVAFIVGVWLIGYLMGFSGDPETFSP